MANTQLLCTFTTPKKITDTINEIKSCYTLVFNKVYILENVNNVKELVCSYNIDPNVELDTTKIPANTISVHRKKETNTIYTINALNYVIVLHNDGKVDNKFPVPWEYYRNVLLVTNTEGLKKIHTKIHSIIDI
jgi:hypothetical protein